MSRPAFRRLALGLLAATLASLSAAAAAAHAHLAASNPAANSAVPAPKSVSLTFNEPLETKFSGLTLTGPVGEVKLGVAPSGDRKALVATPASPLAPGAYKVNWHAVAKDGHRMEGAFTFTVR